MQVGEIFEIFMQMVILFLFFFRQGIDINTTSQGVTLQKLIVI